MSPSLSPRFKTLAIFSFLSLLRLLTLCSLLFALVAQFLTIQTTLESRWQDLYNGLVLISLDDVRYNGTGISLSKGGIAGYMVGSVLTIITLFLSLLSEIPTPAKVNRKLQIFWRKVFPSFGEEHGNGVMGVLMVLFGSWGLSNGIIAFPRVANWFLFIFGIVNVALGATLQSSIYSLRSFAHIYSGSSSSSSLPPPAVSSLRFSHPMPTGRPLISDPIPAFPFLSQPAPSLQPLNLAKLRLGIPGGLKRFRSTHSAAPTSNTRRTARTGISESVYSQDVGTLNAPGSEKEEDEESWGGSQMSEEDEGRWSSGNSSLVPPNMQQIIR